MRGSGVTGLRRLDAFCTDLEPRGDTLLARVRALVFADLARLTPAARATVPVGRK